MNASNTTLENAARAGISDVSRPYKGVESYEIEDGAIFFGRSLETDQLIYKILANRLTLLHARSGAGKTSLLNARIIPGLELRGASVVRSRPGNNPEESLKVATVTTLLPPPAAESLALQRACSALGLKLEAPLSTLLKTFDGLAPSNPLKRALQSSVPMRPEMSSTFYRLAQEAKPLCLRLFRATLAVNEYREHVAALCAVCRTDKRTSVEIYEDTPVSRICEQLAEPLTAEGHTELLEQIILPAQDLYGFFEDVNGFYGAMRTHFSLVLILDQFEELFTRFSDRGQAAAADLYETPHWRLRWSFLDQMEKLYAVGPAPAAQRGREEQAQGSAPLPIRVVIAMRDEYIAELDPIRRAVPSLDNASYHLTFLGKNQAAAALREPAELFSFTYSSACEDEILKELTREDRFIEPAQLQIVCERLWKTLGKELSQGTGKSEIGLESFPAGSAQKILKSFFTDFLEESNFSQLERMEMLEMLEPLVTSQGTRNILEKSALLNARFRDNSRRARLLDELLKARILQRESKLGTEFVEITHEFLIRPILDTLQAELGQHSDFTRLRLALRTLESYVHLDFRDINSGLLGAQDFAVLHENRQIIVWTDWSVELMLRDAIRLGVAKETLRWWCDHYVRNAPSMTAEQVLQVAQSRATLSFDELQIINSQRDQLQLSADQIILILRSEILRAEDEQRNDVRFWTRRLSDGPAT